MLLCGRVLPYSARTAASLSHTAGRVPFSLLSASSLPVSAVCAAAPWTHMRFSSQDGPSDRTPPHPPPPPKENHEKEGMGNAVPVDDILSILFETNQSELGSGIGQKFTQFTTAQSIRASKAKRIQAAEAAKDSIRRRKGRFTLPDDETAKLEGDDGFLLDLEEPSRRHPSRSIQRRKTSSRSESTAYRHHLDDDGEREEDAEFEECTSGEMYDACDELIPDTLQPSDFENPMDLDDMRMSPDGDGRDPMEYVDSSILEEMSDDDKAYLKQAAYKYLHRVKSTQEERAKYRMERAPLLERFLREYSRRTSTLYRLIKDTLKHLRDVQEQGVTAVESASAQNASQHQSTPSLKVNYNQSFGTPEDENDALNALASKYEQDLYTISDDTMNKYERNYLPWKEYHVYAQHAATIQHISNLSDLFDSELRRYFLSVQRFHPVIASLKMDEYERDGGISLKYELLQDIAEAKKDVFALLPSMEEWRKEALHPFIHEPNDRLRFLRSLPMDRYNSYDALTTQIYRLFDRLTSKLIEAFHVTSEYERSNTEECRLAAERALSDVTAIQQSMSWEEWTGVNLNYYEMGKKMEIAGALRMSVNETHLRELDWDLLIPRAYKYEKKYLKNSEYLIQRHRRRVTQYKAHRKAARDANPLYFKPHDNLTEVHPLLLQIAESVPEGKRRDIATMSARAVNFNPRFNLKEKVKVMEELTSGLKDDFLLEHGMSREEYEWAQAEAEKFMRGEGEYVITPDHPLFGDKPDPKHYLRGSKDSNEFVRFDGKFKGDSARWTSSE